MCDKLRVAVIMPEVYHGGAETQFRLLVENLDVERFAITVFIEQSYGIVDRAKGAAWIDDHRDHAKFVKLRNLSSNDGHIRRLHSAVKLGFAITPYLIRQKFDAVITYSALGMRLTPLLRIFGVYSVFSERNDAEYSRLDLLRKRVYFSAAHAIVCNSAAASSNFMRYGYSPLLIENAVLLPATEKVRAPRRRELTLVVPGRIDPLKNQTLVVQVLPALEGLVSQVYFAGAVQDQLYLKHVEDAIAVKDWTARAEVLGFVHDMDALYDKSDLVILPSRAEGMPNVLLEVLVRGIPCIASDIPSHRDVLRNEKLLFSPEDPASLVRAVRHITELTESEADDMAAAYRQYVTERFSVHTLVSAYEELLASLGRGELVGK